MFAVIMMLLVVTLTTFAIFFMIPKWAGSDPALLFVGKQSDPEAIEGIRQKLSLDDPLLVQFWHFVEGLFVGRDYANGNDVTHCPAPCFGYSFRTEQAVWPQLTDAMPVTLSLAAGACVLWLTGGVLTGVVSALRRGSLWDRAAMSIALAGVSLPIYFTGLLSLAVFSYQLNWVDVDYQGLGENPAVWFQSLVLPWITLAFLYAATYARLTRATMLEIMGEDYIRTARAKGLRERVVIGRHAMRSTWTPILTLLGLDLGALLGGAVLTETTYNLPGLGRLAVTAISNKDLPVILGVTLMAALFIVVANLIVDLLYAVVDPRVRLG
ncbi:ABC transporter permease [Streptomyces sp. ME19-01-6]|uniref:ABC transporter permease n=1 Tax=Streptomyces sp. ME19-01-6 TaxID=3028686 RepID=UPI0029A94A88|nr:ABC transporter permease [Streptomyces sp. ME19-01-6]MDX3231041.1 ABC transporter permease [Streptomyces sp. ME19-01-6]